MNHGPSLASTRQDASVTTRSGHKRRHSLSRSLVKGGRRMSGWVAKVYSSSPRRLPAPTPIPPPPPRYPQNLRLSLLSFSTPTLSIHLLPTPPPSPPVSISSLVTEFTKLEMDKTRETNGEGDMNENSYIPTRIDSISSIVFTGPEPPTKSPRRFSGLQSPILCPSFGRSPSPPSVPPMSHMGTDSPFLNLSESDFKFVLKHEPAMLPTPPESQAGSRHSTPPIPHEELGGHSQRPTTAHPQTAQTINSSSIPPPTTSENNIYLHGPRRSMSANLADSFTLASRRRRTTNPAIPAIPPLTLITQPTITTTPPSKDNVLVRRSTTSPLAPPLPPRHLRGLDTPLMSQEITASHLLPELSFSTSPLMPSPLPPIAASSPLRKGGLRPPGSPVRTGAVRNLRLERRSVLLQPSELENRGSAKMNTESFLFHSEEAEGVFPEEKVDLLGADGNKEGYNSLARVLSNTEPPPSISSRRYFPTRSSSLEPSLATPDTVEQFRTPPRLQTPRAVPTHAVIAHIGRTAPIPLPSTPVKDYKGFGGREAVTNLQFAVSKRPLDVEVAFSGESGGIWRKIGAYLEQWDLARLTRASRCIRKSVEPLLYETICLRPNPLHGYSNAYLASLLKSLDNNANKPKLQEWTKNFRIEKGFQVNQTMLMNRDKFLEEEALLDGNRGVVISKRRIGELIKGEGLEGDGGIEEISDYLRDILRHTSNLGAFSLESSLAMNNDAILALGEVKSLDTLKLNLSQPIRRERQRNGNRIPAWVALPKYRPSIPLISGLPLKVLRLNNLPTRGGGMFWKQIWGTIIGLSDTLQILEIEMPRIDQTRYGQLFDCYHRISSLPDSTDDIKIPPVLDWKVYKEVMSDMPPARRKKLRLHTLELTGFIVDTDIINHEIAPGCLKKLQLLGCMERSGFKFSKRFWKGLEVFRSTGLGFIEMVIEALFTIPCNGRKELAFLTESCENCEPNPLSKLRTVVLNAFPKYGCHIENLCLKEQWILNTDELNKIFADVYNGGEGFTELGIALVNTPAAWNVFLGGLKRCKNIRKVQVLNGFSQDENSVYKRKNVQDGSVKRRVYDDALAIAETLFAAELEGLPINLNGVIIAINQCVWRVEWTNNKWGIVRLHGLLKRPVVGYDTLQFV